MNKRFLKTLSVLLTAVMLVAMASVAFAADPALPGSGTKDAPYQVSDAEGLAELANNTAAYDGKYIKLVDDVTLDYSFVPIGTEDVPFKGFFDGAGHSVFAFEIYEGDYTGLFGYVKDASVSNVVIDSASIYSGSNIGMLAGCAENSEISHVNTAECMIEGSSNVGGIVGVVKGGSVTDCINGCSVTASEGTNAGGIAGLAENNSQILRCINEADVMCSYQKNVGGIAGSADGTVSHCLNKGAVASSVLSQTSDATSAVAGIVGSAAGEISFCGNAAEVSCNTDCSGIFTKAGDLTVSYCYNAGNLACGQNYSEKSDTIGLNVAADHCIGVGGDVTADTLKTKDAYEGWDFGAVWYEPGDYHDYSYPVLRDCNFHTIKLTSSSSATCMDEGIEEYGCDDPDCSFSETVTTSPALGHHWVVSKTVPANCTVEGEKTYKCSRCQEEKPEKEIIPVDPDEHVDEDGDNICDLCKQTIKQEETKRNFFQKIIDFFKRIFDWIKNLFKKK